MAVDLKLYTDKGRAGAVGTYYQDDNGYYEVVEGTSTRSSAKTITDENGLLKEVVNDFTPISYENGESYLNLEGTAINLFNNTEDFSSSQWSKERCSVGTGGTSPTGGVMQKIIPSTELGGHSLRVAKTTQSGSYIQSIYVRPNGYNYFAVSSSLGSAKFDLTNNTVVSGDGIIEEFSNGIVRLGFFDVYSLSTPNFRFSVYDDVSFSAFEGDGVSGVDVWGANLILGNSFSSYVKDASTRQADSITNIGREELFNSLKGSYEVELSCHTNGGSNRYLSLNDGSDANRIELIFSATANRIDLQIKANSVTVTSGAVLEIDQTVRRKYRLEYESGNTKLFIDDVERISTTSSYVFSNPISNFNFARGNETNPFLGKVYEATIKNY